MPSLQQLEEFRSSFKDVGGEALFMKNNQLPLDELKLPDNEPPAPFPDELGSGPDMAPNLDDLGLDLPADNFPDTLFDTAGGGPENPDSFAPDEGTGADFDFGDLLGEVPLDTTGAADPDDFGAAFPEESAGTPANDPDELGNLEDLPADLLSGFADDLEAGGLPADEGIPAIPEATSPAVSANISEGPADLDLPEFPDIDLSQAMDMGGESRETGGEAASEVPETPAGISGDLQPSLEGEGSPLDFQPSLEGEGSPLELQPSLEGEGSPLDFQPSLEGEGSPLDFQPSLEGEGSPLDFQPSLEGEGSPLDFQPSLEGEGSPLDPQPSLEGEGSPLDFSQAIDLGGEGDFGDFEASGPGPAEVPAANAGDFDATDLDIPDFGSADEASENFESGLDLPDLETPDLVEDAVGLGTPDDADFGTAGLDVPDFDSGTKDIDGGDTFGAAEFGSMSEVPTADSSQGADSFDNFDLGGEDWKPPVENLDTPDFSAPPADDFGDFSLAGFDDTFTSGSAPSGAARPFPSASKDDIEEIHLSETEYKSLQETLSVYPLNLRIACEELIAEQAVAPELMSALIKLLVRGAPAKETASMAGKILGRTIPVPKGYAKQTGAELEEEQSSFGYVFVHSFLPVLRLFGAIALVAASLFYLTWRFVITPLRAESLYKEGYTMLQSGEYIRANERFSRAFETYRVKKWFYRYAEGFRDERQYIYAERKYDELLRVYPRDKKGALDYAALETYYLQNYEKADRIIRTNILDYAINDREGLIALAENNLAWGETDPSRYEEARSAYARLIEKYGRQDPFLEGMLKYFIRTDKLNEVLPLRSYFMTNPKKRKISVPTLAELGGYLLDKKFTEVEGVPDEYVDKIEGIRDVLLRAINADRMYPESYYHLARYYNRYGSTAEERASLQDAIRAFDNAREETAKRAAYRVDAHRRYAEVLINAGEFFPAEEELIRGIRIYEDARARQILKTHADFGRLYADLGDLEFFAKGGDTAAALRFYQEGERNGWAPPEVQYRMGAAHYQNEEWEEALQRFFALTPSMPNNKRLLYALGNVSYMRGNYFAAQGYYNRLMDLLDAERVRFPNLMPGSRPEEMDLVERIMVADNNLGLTLEALTRISGDTKYRSRALGLFSESIRAWDVLTRNPDSMVRMRPLKDLYGPGINLAYLNAQNILHPEPSYEPQLFMRIDRDALEPSAWEALIPRDYQLSDQLLPMQVE